MVRVRVRLGSVDRKRGTLGTSQRARSANLDQISPNLTLILRKSHVNLTQISRNLKASHSASHAPRPYLGPLTWTPGGGATHSRLHSGGAPELRPPHRLASRPVRGRRWCRPAEHVPHRLPPRLGSGRLARCGSRRPRRGSGGPLAATPSSPSPRPVGRLLVGVARVARVVARRVGAAQLVSHRFLVDRSPASTGWMDVGVQSGDEECVEGLYVNTVEWT